MTDPPSITVALPCFNESDTIERALQGIQQQQLQPRQVLVADGGSTDGTIEILNRWASKLPLTIIDNPDRRQGPGLNLCLERCETPLFARLDGHSYWNPDYLEKLVSHLTQHTELAGAGGVVSCSADADAFQRDAWNVMRHPLGTGAPSYRTAEDTTRTDSLQAPIYRTEALNEVGGFPENLPWAEDDELHKRIRNRGWKLLVDPDVKLNYYPRKTHRGFLRQFYNYGQGRGQLGALHIFPSDRHETIDGVLKLWSFGLCWNPIGWGLFLFYLLSTIVITFEERRQNRSSLRFVYLLPLAHLSYWTGWLKTRFRNQERPSG